jgi:long-chain fatty acid transport protein
MLTLKRTTLLLLLTLLLPGRALGGGLYMAGHGVRGLARGGAFTAGGDDPGGIWYNPANIGGLDGIHVLVDASMVLLHMDYTRVDSGGNLLPTVSNEGGVLPLPTIALATSVLDRRLALGFSFSAPYAPLPGYPAPSYDPCANPGSPSHCIDTAHTDSPQRYNLINLDGTLFLQLDLAATYRVIDGLWVGVSLQNLFASFVTLNSITSYNGALSSGPEDPDFDSLSQTELVDLFNPSAKFGVIYQPHPMVRIGASLQLPFWVGGDATVKVQLPVSPVYEKSSVEGDTADVSITLPMVLRLGVEGRPLPNLRVELGFDYERWSVLDAITVKPKDIYILNIPSIDRYKVPDLEIPLSFRDTFTIRLGGEYTLAPVPLVLRGGFIFERGAVDDAYASVLAMDSDKYMLTLGLGYTWAGYRMDLLYAHEFRPVRDVDFRDSRSLQVNPINPTGAVAVGGGRYEGSSDVLGIGVTKAF